MAPSRLGSASVERLSPRATESDVTGTQVDRPLATIAIARATSRGRIRELIRHP
jgi:hypothetical protein